jgi:ABC-type sugar transport system permease subunit
MPTATRPPALEATERPDQRRTRSGRSFPFLALAPAWVFLVLLIGYPLLKVLWDAFQHADHLNAYLTDPDEYRALTRHLLHAGGQIDYTTHAITITLDRPDSPRLARALTLLTEELNALAASLPGDHRPLTYQLTTP